MSVADNIKIKWNSLLMLKTLTSTEIVTEVSKKLDDFLHFIVALSLLTGYWFFMSTSVKKYPRVKHYYPISVILITEKRYWDLY